MKLIEAMKRIKVIEKQIASNSGRISEYAAIVSTERPAFGTEDAQRKEIRGLIQSSEDLLLEYLRLKSAVLKTNLVTTVAIQGRNYSVADLLVLRRGGAKLMKQTYASLSTQNADHRLGLVGRASVAQTGEKSPHVERMYDEKEKHAGIQKWQDLEDEIEMRLETINAVTDLVE